MGTTVARTLETAASEDGTVRAGDLEKARAAVGAGAKDLVERLLRRDPARRCSVGDALRHPWVTSAPKKVDLEKGV